MLDSHGFMKRGVVLHRKGLFAMMGGESLGYVDPGGDVAGYFDSMRVVDTEGKEWRVKSWTKLAFAGLKHRRGKASHQVELEPVGEVSVDDLRGRMKAAMTPAAFDHAYVDADEQREAAAAVDAASSFEDLARAIRNF